jgi:leucyl aminopeptidase
MTNSNALIQPDKGQDAIAIHLVNKDSLPAWLANLNNQQRAALAAQKFDGGGYEYAIVPDGDGWFAVGGVANPDHLSSWCLAKLAEVLPAGTYRRVGGDAGPAMLGWVTGQYRFDRYRSEPGSEGPRTLLTNQVKAIAPALAEAAATAWVRDLVNTPAEDMGPAELEAAAESLVKLHKAQLRVTRGDALERQFPMVHMVGRAAARDKAPRMIELEWGDPTHPRIAVIGKGVCFDTGGLDLKQGSSMLLMKKDMGGAAHALALASLIMASGLKVQLHLLVPAAENSVSANAFRPGDVLRSRAGISVEIGNTDAEGRLLLGDALTCAGEGTGGIFPDLIIDFATLTGAARAALGPDLPALFARNDATAAALLAAGTETDDPCWRLPLWDGYRDYLKSDIADINNAHTNGFAGASVAALFLDKFVPEGTDWAHFDTFAWRPIAKPGRPKGGDALGLRAAWRMLQSRFG